MVQDLYKWEGGGILKHHCPICQTPLAHEKCRTTCLGKHVEWCHRYHSLFRKNWSSRCSACKTTDEQHEKRHREIAEILAQIKKYEAEEDAVASPTAPGLSRTPLTVRALNVVNNNDALSLEALRTTKKERKAAKKAAKACGRVKVITTADIAFVAQTLHPEADQSQNESAADFYEDADIKLNLKFNNSTCTTKSDRHDFVQQLDRGPVVLEVERILATFKVTLEGVGPKQELAEKLVGAIKNDQTHVRDELHMTARNRAGFWRWANRKHYRDILDNGKAWDCMKYSIPKVHDGVGAGESAVGGEVEDEVEDEVEAEMASSGTTRSNSLETPSLTNSADTVLTIPSIQGLDNQAQAEEDVDGWTRVGKKRTKSAPGKVKLSGNGGLNKFRTNQPTRFAPPSGFGWLSWADGAKSP